MKHAHGEASPHSSSTHAPRHNEIFRCGTVWVKHCRDGARVYFTVVNDRNNTHRHYNRKRRAIQAAVGAGDGKADKRQDAAMRRDIMYLTTGIKVIK